jgi:hypothetical protein
MNRLHPIRRIIAAGAFAALLLTVCAAQSAEVQAFKSRLSTATTRRLP